jgi:hypothetical protein
MRAILAKRRRSPRLHLIHEVVDAADGEIVNFHCRVDPDVSVSAERQGWF